MKLIDKDVLLVDLIEGELDDSFKHDVETWIDDHSEIKSDFHGLSRIRGLVKASAPAEIQVDDLYYKHLENKIMSRVLSTKMRSKTRVRILENLSWQRAAAGFVFVLAVGSTFWAERLNRPVFTAVDSTENQSPSQVIDPTSYAGEFFNEGTTSEHSASTELLIETSAKNTNVVAETLFTSESDSDLLLDATGMRIDGLDEQEASKALDQLMQ